MGSLSRVRMFVFDMAGTTVNEKGIVYKTFKDTFKEFGIRIPDDEFVRYYGMQKTQVISEVVDRIPTIDESNKIRIYDRFKDNLKNNYMKEDSMCPMEGSLELFDFLRERGIKVCLNTGFDREMASFVVNRLNFNYHIDDYVSSSDVSRGRPQPFMIRKLMERSHISDPQQVVKVGDTTLDILEGRNSRTLHQFAVLTGEESEKSLLKSEPSGVFANLKDLKTYVEKNL